MTAHSHKIQGHFVRDPKKAASSNVIKKMSTTIINIHNRNTPNKNKQQLKN